MQHLELWPSNTRRARCPNCDNFTLFKKKFEGYWVCYHMEGFDYCGYSELISED